MNYTIRKLKPFESKLYRTIRLESLKAYPEYFGSNYEAQLKLDKLYFEKVIEEGTLEGVMMGAFVNDDLVAICGVSFKTDLIPNAGEIIQMYVKKRFQGKKLSKALMEYIVENIRTYRDIDILVLGVDKSNSIAIKSYLSCGFIMSSEIKDDVKTSYMTFHL